MALVGTLAIVGFLLLFAQLVFGAALNSATHDSSLVFVPLALGSICLWVAFWRGLAKGPAAVQVAVLLGFASLALFGYSILAMNANIAALSAASAALFILAITLGVFAYSDQRATRHESSVRE